MVCPKCGATIEDGATSCPYCGEVVSAPQAAPQVNTNPIQGERPQPRIENTSSDHTAEFTEADRRNNHVLGLVCYMGLYVLIPLLTVKKSRFVKFHANQGIVLMLANIVIQVINVVVTLLFGVLGGVASGIGAAAQSEGAILATGGILGVISFLWSLFMAAIGIFFFVITIIGMVTAAQGKAKALPLISKIHLIKY